VSHAEALKRTPPLPHWPWCLCGVALVFLNVPAMQQPEAYIGGPDKLFDASGKLTNDGTRKFLEQFMQAFANWIAATGKS
jgi:hypothetical protein